MRRALKPKEADRVGPLGRVARGVLRVGAACVAVLDAIDLFVASVLGLAVLAVLWLDQWGKSPAIALVLLYLGFLTIRKWFRSTRHADRHG